MDERMFHHELLKATKRRDRGEHPITGWATSAD